MHAREGLIRARLLGAEKATGDVLIFLDSHCECTEGWIEPLVDPIARNSNVTTMPIIEIIDDNTFELEGTCLVFKFILKHVLDLKKKLFSDTNRINTSRWFRLGFIV